MKRTVPCLAMLLLIYGVAFSPISAAERPAERRAERRAERDAVVTVGGCSGFVVAGHLLVTAKHCEHPRTISVTLQGKTVAATRVYVASGDDGPVVFRLAGGPYTSLPVATRRPEIGDRVYSLGYPNGNWARIEGTITGGYGKDVNYTNHRIATGNSGGPLLNARGEVIGVALHVAQDINVHSSGFSGWKVTTDAIRAAGGGMRAPPPTPVVVVFASPECGPCRQLEQDVRAGHFRGYRFQFVTWNARSHTWTHPELYREFVQRCRPAPGQFAYPTIWIQGTNRYRVGYTTKQRGGLLHWIAAGIRHLLEGLFGRYERSPESRPQPIPDPGPDGNKADPVPPETPSPPDNATRALVAQLLSDMSALRSDAEKTRDDLKQFRESGVVGKIKAIARLKSDKDVALERVTAVKSDVARLKSNFHEHPLQFLWGLIGIVSGLIHRRFAN